MNNGFNERFFTDNGKIEINTLAPGSRYIQLFLYTTGAYKNLTWLGAVL